MHSSYLSTFLAFNLALAIPTTNLSPRNENKHAIYFQDNDPAGVSIIALHVAQDGTLSNPVRTPTGGKGLAGLVAASQDSIRISGNVRSINYFTLYISYPDDG